MYSKSRRRGPRRVEALEERRLLASRIFDLSSLAGELSALFESFDSGGHHDAAIKAQGFDFTAPAGSAADHQVALFRTRGDVSGVTAMIDWGDGTKPTTGAITLFPFANPVFGGGSVSGKHTFAQAGIYTVTTTLTDAAGDTASATAHASVGTESITATGLPIVAFPGQTTGTAPVASFTDSLGLAPPESYTATIDWGDGTAPSTGEVVPGPMLGDPSKTDPPVALGYLVLGEHSYAADGSYKVAVTIQGSGGGTATAGTSATVTEILTHGLPVQATTGIENMDTAVAGFAVADPRATADAFTATIDWGDGSKPTAGTIVAVSLPGDGPGKGDGKGDGDHAPPHSGGHDGPSGFLVTGSHTYIKAGSDTITVTIADKNGHTAVATSTATVTAAAPIHGIGLPLVAAAGTAFDGVAVAAFPAPEPLPAAADVSATIDWGDGSKPTSGTVRIVAALLSTTGDENGGEFDHPSLLILGGHTYAQPGPYTLHVSITLKGGTTGLAEGHILVLGTPAPPPTAKNPAAGSVDPSLTISTMPNPSTGPQPSVNAATFQAGLPAVAVVAASPATAAAHGHGHTPRGPHGHKILLNAHHSTHHASVFKAVGARRVTKKG